VGDLSTGKIMIEEGAYLKGGVEIGSNNTQIGTDLDTLLSGAKKTEKSKAGEIGLNFDPNHHSTPAI
jgi:hypothetical protein